MLSVENVALLSAILWLGFVVESVAGFGATVVALALGVRYFAIDQLLAWFLPLNLVLSTYLAIRHRRHIDRPLLLRRIVPAMLVGLAAGTALLQVLSPEGGARVFAAVVVVIAALELARLIYFARRPPPPSQAPPRALQLAVLTVAGVVHGLFATGGPLAVAVVHRSVPDKSTLRATLAGLWMSLNLLVEARLVATGVLNPHSLAISATLIPALVLALVAGEYIHHRVPERPFRYLVAALLGVTGVLLLIR